MGLTLTNDARSAACNAVVDLVDAGTGVAQGYIKIQTSGDSDLVQIDFDTPPAFGAAVNGVATLNNAPKSGTASGTGTAAKFRVYDRDDTEIWQGTVTLTSGGGDIELDSLSITSGQDVYLNTYTHTAPGS
jgi:hypothetical protein